MHFSLEEDLISNYFAAYQQLRFHIYRLKMYAYCSLKYY